MQKSKTYKTKSLIIGRKKGGTEDFKPCFFAFFDVNNPHQKNLVPKKIVEFERVHKVIIEGLDVNYLLPGNDIVINNLKTIELKQDGEHIHIKGKQSHI
ncbi:MAG: hypothetical protein QXR60_01575 [Candidatus Nanoarchaeia archaeon]